MLAIKVLQDGKSNSAAFNATECLLACSKFNSNAFSTIENRINALKNEIGLILLYKMQ
ncbi:hypothetical protein D3C75_819850 [compost metagenome]